MSTQKQTEIIAVVNLSSSAFKSLEYRQKLQIKAFDKKATKNATAKRLKNANPAVSRARMHDSSITTSSINNNINNINNNNNNITIVRTHTHARTREESGNDEWQAAASRWCEYLAVSGDAHMSVAISRLRQICRNDASQAMSVVDYCIAKQWRNLYPIVKKATSKKDEEWQRYLTQYVND